MSGSGYVCPECRTRGPWQLRPVGVPTCLECGAAAVSEEALAALDRGLKQAAACEPGELTVHWCQKQGGVIAGWREFCAHCNPGSQGKHGGGDD
jgi:hypothetical protein